MKTSKKYLKITVNILTMAALIALCVWGLPYILRFFLPFVIAGVIALLANPVVRFLEKRIKIKRKAGTVVVIVLVLAIISFIVYAICAKLIQELMGLIKIAPILWGNIVMAIRNFKINGHFPFAQAITSNYYELTSSIGEKLTEGLSSWFDSLISGIGSSSVDETASGSSFTSSIPLAIVSVITTIIASYMFVAERDYLKEFVNKYVPNGVNSRIAVVASSIKTAVGGYFSAQLKIMVVVYFVLLVGLVILGVDYAVLVAFIIALLDFLPFFGTGTIMWPWAIIAAIQSDYKYALGILILWAISQLVRQFIQPKLLSVSIGLDPIPTLFLLYIGFRVGGALGLIFAAPIGLIVLNLYKAGLFSNFILSLKILYKDFTKLRRFSDEELESLGMKRKDSSDTE